MNKTERIVWAVTLLDKYDVFICRKSEFTGAMEIWENRLQPDHRCILERNVILAYGANPCAHEDDIHFWEKEALDYIAYYEKMNKLCGSG